MNGIYIQTNAGPYVVPFEKERQLIAWLEANAYKPLQTQPAYNQEAKTPDQKQQHLLFE
jgi:hypothetical protein